MHHLVYAALFTQEGGWRGQRKAPTGEKALLRVEVVHINKGGVGEGGDPEPSENADLVFRKCNVSLASLLLPGDEYVLWVDFTRTD